MLTLYDKEGGNIARGHWILFKQKLMNKDLTTAQIFGFANNLKVQARKQISQQSSPHKGENLSGYKLERSNNNSDNLQDADNNIVQKQKEESFKQMGTNKINLGSINEIDSENNSTSIQNTNFNQTHKVTSNNESSSKINLQTITQDKQKSDKKLQENDRLANKLPTHLQEEFEGRKQRRENSRRVLAKQKTRTLSMEKVKPINLKEESQEDIHLQALNQGQGEGFLKRLNQLKTNSPKQSNLTVQQLANKEEDFSEDMVIERITPNQLIEYKQSYQSNQTKLESHQNLPNTSNCNKQYRYPNSNSIQQHFRIKEIDNEDEQNKGENNIINDKNNNMISQDEQIKLKTKNEQTTKNQQITLKLNDPNSFNIQQNILEKFKAQKTTFNSNKKDEIFKKIQTGLLLFSKNTTTLDLIHDKSVSIDTTANRNTKIQFTKGIRAQGPGQHQFNDFKNDQKQSHNLKKYSIFIKNQNQDNNDRQNSQQQNQNQDKSYNQNQYKIHQPSSFQPQNYYQNQQQQQQHQQQQQQQQQQLQYQRNVQTQDQKYQPNKPQNLGNYAGGQVNNQQILNKINQIYENPTKYVQRAPNYQYKGGKVIL